VIEDDVEIGANSTVDRGALAETRVRRGTKIDNLVHIGHNCDIGEDVILVMGTGISGSSTVGKGAVLAGQVGIGDHAHVGSGVILAARPACSAARLSPTKDCGLEPCCGERRRDRCRRFCARLPFLDDWQSVAAKDPPKTFPERE